MKPDKAKAIVDEVFSLYEKYGNEDYIGEPVSQLEHMLQTAQLAESEGSDDEVVLAAFFHDIGHLYEHVEAVKTMDGYGVEHHEEMGYWYVLNKGFSQRIARMIEGHVSAKRYLTFKFPDYYNKLSPASRITLQKQGGKMSPEEARIFESDELFELFIKLRKWDDLAKEQKVSLPPLHKYKMRAFNHLLNQ